MAVIDGFLARDVGWLILSILLSNAGGSRVPNTILKRLRGTRLSADAQGFPDLAFGRLLTPKARSETSPIQGHRRSGCTHSKERFFMPPSKKERPLNKKSDAHWPG